MSLESPAAPLRNLAILLTVVVAMPWVELFYAPDRLVHVVFVTAINGGAAIALFVYIQKGNVFARAILTGLCGLQVFSEIVALAILLFFHRLTLVAGLAGVIQTVLAVLIFILINRPPISTMVEE